MKMLCCIQAPASAKHPMLILAEHGRHMHKDELHMWQIRLSDRKVGYVDTSEEKYLSGSLSWPQDAVEAQVFEDTKSAKLMAQVDSHSLSVLSNARATPQCALHS